MRTKANNPYEQSILDNVQEYGWHCTSVNGEGDEPSFTYSVGLSKSFDHPEILIIGLSGQLSHNMLSIIARAAEEGRPFDLDAGSDSILANYECFFVKVPKDRYEEFVLSANWFYEGTDFPLYQVVWPSVEGQYPWDNDADEKLKEIQPVLGPRNSPPDSELH